MKRLLVICTVTAFAVASDYERTQEYKREQYGGYTDDGYNSDGGYKEVEEDYSKYTYHGMYYDKCGYDGLYYRDDRSFVFCSNGNSYVQPCSPGTKNSPYKEYSYGGTYSHRDFCEVNLVDYGYSEKAYDLIKKEHSYAKKQKQDSYSDKKNYIYGHYEEGEKKSNKKPVRQTMAYHGMFPGKCQYDGIYYRDERSFVFCSNRNSYVQPCSPGTKNSAYETYNYGDKYNPRDFCDVNLIDYGYTAHARYAPKPVGYGYDDGYKDGEAYGYESDSYH